MMDYREIQRKDSTKWNYFIYKDSATGFVLDTILSHLDLCYFDQRNRKFVGSKTIRLNDTSTQTNNYDYVDGVVSLVQQVLCTQAYRFAEKIDCDFYELENGVLVFRERIFGPE